MDNRHGGRPTTAVTVYNRHSEPRDYSQSLPAQNLLEVQYFQCSMFNVQLEVEVLSSRRVP